MSRRGSNLLHRGRDMNLYVYRSNLFEARLNRGLMMTDRRRIHDLRGDIATGVSAMCVLTAIRMRGEEGRGIILIQPRYSRRETIEESLSPLPPPPSPGRVIALSRYRVIVAVASRPKYRGPLSQPREPTTAN